MRISDWSSDVCSSDLRGPGSFNVAAANAAPANSVTLSALLDTKRVRRARTGAVRGSLGEAPTAAPRRPNLWLVAAAQSGTPFIADSESEIGSASCRGRVGKDVLTLVVSGPYQKTTK